MEHLEPEIRLAADGHHGGNYKSSLQQVAQRELRGTPCIGWSMSLDPIIANNFASLRKFSGKRYTPAWGRKQKRSGAAAAGMR